MCLPRIEPPELARDIDRIVRPSAAPPDRLSPVRYLAEHGHIDGRRPLPTRRIPADDLAAVGLGRIDHRISQPSGFFHADVLVQCDAEDGHLRQRRHGCTIAQAARDRLTPDQFGPVFSPDEMHRVQADVTGDQHQVARPPHRRHVVADADRNPRILRTRPPAQPVDECEFVSHYRNTVVSCSASCQMGATGSLSASVSGRRSQCHGRHARVPLSVAGCMLGRTRGAGRCGSGMLAL